MDLLDLIEAHRFLGNEFLVWLWYKCDLFEGRFVIGRHGVCEVWFDDRITLEAVIVETEQSVLKGASPTFSPEAREALRQGKLPSQAKLRLITEGREFQFVLKASSLQLSGIKIPALMTRAEDEKFYERMALLEQLEAMMEDLYAEFLAVRLSPGVWRQLHTHIQAWVYDEAHLEREEYRALVEGLETPNRVKRSVRVARADAAALEASHAELTQAEETVAEARARSDAEEAAEPAAAPAQAPEEAPAAPF